MHGLVTQEQNKIDTIHNAYKQNVFIRKHLHGIQIQNTCNLLCKVYTCNIQLHSLSINQSSGKIAVKNFSDDVK